MDNHVVIVIGDSAKREVLFAEWSSDQDPWFVRRDVVRIDAESVSDLDVGALDGATVLGDMTAPEVPTLDTDPWTAKEQAFALWPDKQQRLRQLQMHHLQLGWPIQLMPRVADTPARVLGYLLRVHE